MENEKNALLAQAKQKMIEDMRERGIGAIIWNIADAGFHYIPALVIDEENGAFHTARVTGLYQYRDNLYAIEEDIAGVEVEDFYTPGVDVPPVVVTLSEDKALEHFGNPQGRKGFTTKGSLEEWVAVADCYFEALAEE